MLEFFVGVIREKSRIKVCIIVNFLVMSNISGLGSLDCLYCCLGFEHVDGVNV